MFHIDRNFLKSIILKIFLRNLCLIEDLCCQSRKHLCCPWWERHYVINVIYWNVISTLQNYLKTSHVLDLQRLGAPQTSIDRERWSVKPLNSSSFPLLIHLPSQCVFMTFSSKGVPAELSTSMAFMTTDCCYFCYSPPFWCCSLIPPVVA